ncbi:hypothetical protein PV762_06220 [Mitsuaria sp. CC2]|uniref:hypothetical protein n=1 Tax=Mitsuaria sp. CC2 TaxID=3029186 RepID=UPI003B8BC23C
MPLMPATMSFFRLASILLTLCAALVLSACSTPAKPYVPPTDGDLAQIRSAIYMSSGDSADLYVQVGLDAKEPFTRFYSLYGVDNKVTDFINIRAGQYIRVNYFEKLSAGRTCEIRVAFMLEPGKRYSLIGGAHFEPGTVLKFLPVRGCQLGLKDESTGAPVPMLPRRD